MRSVNIAELKNQLSACLQRVRAGEELVVRDRNIPIARIVPLNGEDLEAEELSLVASGKMMLPKKPFNEERFWSIGARIKTPDLRAAIQKAVDGAREEPYAGLLGHQRNRAHLRPRPNKRRG